MAEYPSNTVCCRNMVLWFFWSVVSKSKRSTYVLNQIPMTSGTSIISSSRRNSTGVNWAGTNIIGLR